MAQAFVSFFAILDPIGNIIIFHLLTRRLEFRQKAQVAVITTTAAFLLLLLFSLGGQEGLRFLGISDASFEVAAGLLLLPPAYRLVTQGEPDNVRDDEQRDPFDFALVPLATPLIAGPGGLAATTSFSQSLGQTTTIAAFSLVLFLTLLAFLAADILFRVIGVPVLRLLSRLVGIILVAIAVDFILEGSRAFFEAAIVLVSI